MHTCKVHAYKCNVFRQQPGAMQGRLDAGCGKCGSGLLIPSQLEAGRFPSAKGERGHHFDLWHIRHRKVHSGIPSGPKVGHLHDHVDRLHPEHAQVSSCVLPTPFCYRLWSCITPAAAVPACGNIVHCSCVLVQGLCQ